MFNLFRKKQSEYEYDYAPAENCKFLYGFDLREWHYLGLTELRVSDSTIELPCDAYFFCRKDDHNVRDYVLKGPKFAVKYCKEEHLWVQRGAEQWKAGERELYMVINKEASNFLKQYMLDKFAVIWDKDIDYWARNDASMHAAAVNHQKEEPKAEIKAEVTQLEDNVVSVTFKKPETNEDRKC